MSGARKLALAHFAVAITAFAVASAMAVMQAMSRAEVQVPGRTSQMYYMSVTAHGVLMALVFTTFFIMGLGYVVARTALDRPLPAPRLGWLAYAMGTLGVLLTTVAILSGRSSVLYTFYPPLKAHPAFYIGLALVIVASWIWGGIMIAAYRGWKRANPGRPVPLAMHGTVANVILWFLCTVGVAVEVVGLLIPWSLGWTKTVDPVLARTLFWYFGHPLVYFWLLPAYVAWYTILPRAAGGKLFSDLLGRAVFVLFILFSTPVGFHHQFMDPGIPSEWKMFHAMNTYAILFPSLVTAFTILASVEIAGRMRGGRGWFGWIGTLPWHEPLVAAVLLSMLTFALGGFGGAINAAFGMNAMVHNTAWIQAHFHLTVGTAVALTFMGLTYWLLPRLTGRELRFAAFAQVQPWLWFLGMMLFSLSNHVSGLMGMPRRVYDAQYLGSSIAQKWAPWTAVSAGGGVILFTSAICFVVVVVGTILWGRRIPGDAPAVVYAEALDPPVRETMWDRLGLWTILAVVLIVIAYAYPLYQLLRLQRFGSPGFSPF